MVCIQGVSDILDVEWFGPWLDPLMTFRLLPTPFAVLGLQAFVINDNTILSPLIIITHRRLAHTVRHRIGSWWSIRMPLGT